MIQNIDKYKEQFICFYIFEGVILVEVLKVSAKSSPNSVAGALAGVLREKELLKYKL